MGEPALAAHLGYPEGASPSAIRATTVLNHEWWDPDTFATVGTIGAERIAELSDGRLRQSVDVRLNRAVVEHDVTLIVGPVFPHEVVGFSGGNKYLFPGVAGQELIDLSHWLGALITSAEIIGTRGITPVRALIDEARPLVPGERLAFCVVVEPGDQRACTRPRSATPSAPWAAAADVSARDPRPLPRRTGAPRAVAGPGQVRGHVDRRQGLLQGRAGRRRRRPGRPLRPAHPRGQP